MGTFPEVQVLPRAGHSERSEAQLHKGDRMWEGSVDRKLRADVQEPYRQRCRARRAGMNIEQTAQAIRTNWPQIRKALLPGRYRPSPVRKVMIPKSDGSQRELGIPTVLDRLIQ